jgi:uncharacterized protein (DUF2147 family)
MTKLIITCVALFCSFSIYAQSQDSYNGLWWNDDRSGIVELIVSEQGITGLTRWGEKPETDRHNPDPALQKRSLKGITFLWGFTYDAKGNTWKDGKVYDPNNGKTYSAKIDLDKSGNRLEMRGYVGISLFGRTAIFERVKQQDIPDDF